ncbi:hypothetical protein [Leptospira terpstrae]|uniref:Lipoprotein n=1 Tax=Leptospira terpstrae serovar Hualin str. LT 11-33 = ATCC 700639 TaxID=1257025 RepID=N1VUI0_9LEPT|nr:hypothetical protein [Leptospira terpstrae]EMY60662.1 putative lipoprotein [Leptospira terpstrae serovar Hualin str. LT 11-33 = ATCC 700639]
MRILTFLIFLTFTISCVSLKKDDVIIKEAVLSDEFNYEPNGDKIAIRFFVENANIIGRLYKQKLQKLQVRKKVITKFNYDKQGFLLSESNGPYWPVQVIAWVATLGFYIPITVYDFTSAYFKVGESEEFEAIEMKSTDSFEFKEEYFQNDNYTVSIKGVNGLIKVIDSEFSFPINALISAKVSNIEYSLFKGGEVVKSDKIPDFSGHISGESKQFQNWSASIANERKQKEESRRRWEQKTNLMLTNYLSRLIRYPGFPGCRDDRSIDLKKWEYKYALNCSYTNPNTGYTMWQSEIDYYEIEIECTQRNFESKMPIYKQLYVNSKNEISENRFNLECSK